MLFRVKAGKHTDRKGRTYRPGELVESDRDLRKTWVNKFDLVEAPSEAARQLAPPKASPIEQDDKQPSVPTPSPTTSDAAEVESKLGMNVTEDFPAAAEHGMLVFQKGAKFFVTTQADPNKAIHAKPLKQAEVDGVCQKVAEDE